MSNENQDLDTEKTSLTLVEKFYWRNQINHEFSHLLAADTKADIASMIAGLDKRLMAKLPEQALDDLWVWGELKLPHGFVNELITKEKVRRSNIKDRPKVVNVTAMIQAAMKVPFPNVSSSSAMPYTFGEPLKVVVRESVAAQLTDPTPVYIHGVQAVAELLDSLIQKYDIRGFKVLAKPTPTVDASSGFVFFIDTMLNSPEDAGAFNAAKETAQYRNQDDSTKYISPESVIIGAIAAASGITQ